MDNETLIYSRFFPRNNGQGFWRYLYNVIKDFKRVIKYSHQRARRGWADCDVWAVDAWFIRVVPEMLEHLADNSHGSPISFVYEGLDKDGKEVFSKTGHKAWENCLKQMAYDLRAEERHNQEWFDSGKYDSILHEECTKAELEAYSKTKAGLLAFSEYFHNLWD